MAGTLVVYAFEWRGGDVGYPIGATLEVVGVGFYTFPTMPPTDITLSLAPGDYVLNVSYAEYPAQTKTATILEGQTTTVTFNFGKYAPPPGILPSVFGPLGRECPRLYGRSLNPRLWLVLSRLGFTARVV